MRRELLGQREGALKHYIGAIVVIARTLMWIITNHYTDEGVQLDSASIGGPLWT